MGVTFHSKHLDPPYAPLNTCWNTRDYNTSGNPLRCNLAPTLTSLFQTLCDAHAALASYVSIGKTINNRDIWLYRIGNPNGGCVLWDGCTHAWEDIGAEVQYLIANWLLTSGDPKAQELLQTNYILFVPDVNPDSLERGNANLAGGATYGVDLNRNYVNGWTYTSPPGTSNSPYHGASAGSERETQAMRGVFQTYKPKVYVNCHYGGGPSLQYYNSNTISTDIRNRIATLDPAFPWGISANGTVNGYAVNDAVSLIGTGNVSTWLWEIAADTGTPYKTGTGTDCYMHNTQTLADIQNWYFPKMLTAFVAMCEAVATVQPTQYTLTINLTGGGGWTDPLAGTYTYIAGTVVPVKHFQNAGWAFDYWQLDGANAGSGDPINVTMNANHTLQAMYVTAPTTRKVTINSSPELNVPVYVDGAKVGNTPITLDLTVGVQYTIAVDSEVTA